MGCGDNGVYELKSDLPEIVKIHYSRQWCSKESDDFLYVDYAL